jgi:hypothetical protein
MVDPGISTADPKNPAEATLAPGITDVLLLALRFHLYTGADFAIGAGGECADSDTILQIDNTSASGIDTGTGLSDGVSAFGSSTRTRIGLNPAP